LYIINPACLTSKLNPVARRLMRDAAKPDALPTSYLESGSAITRPPHQRMWLTSPQTRFGSEEGNHLWPQFAGDGRHVVYAAEMPDCELA
jgi:hypothetical protein